MNIRLLYKLSYKIQASQKESIPGLQDIGQGERSHKLYDTEGACPLLVHAVPG